MRVEEKIVFDGARRCKIFERLPCCVEMDGFTTFARSERNVWNVEHSDLFHASWSWHDAPQTERKKYSLVVERLIC